MRHLRKMVPEGSVVLQIWSQPPQWVLLSSGMVTLKAVICNGQHDTRVLLRYTELSQDRDRRLPESLNPPLSEISHVGTDSDSLQLYTKAGGRAARTGVRRQASLLFTLYKSPECRVWVMHPAFLP